VRHLVIIMALLQMSCAVWLKTGSIYRTRHTHIGIRPAVDKNGDWAITLQITTDKLP